MKKFEEEVSKRLIENSVNQPLKAAAKKFMVESTKPKYSYNFSWLGRPVIQYPQDIIAIQELIWKVKPDLIIETGIAHGGSLILSASMMALLDIVDAEAHQDGSSIVKSKRKVLGIDIDIREHNKKEIERHPLASRISMLQGSSIEPSIVEAVKNYSKSYKKILVCLDSNHTDQHVYEELKAYAPLVSVGSYCVVFDTMVEYLPENYYEGRNWGPGNSPKSAVDRYLQENHSFEVDHAIDNQLLISVAPGGYIKRIR
jgi:cephalosporin hydroxylase